MKPLFCKSAGLTPNCDMCKHNPANQRGEPKGQEIKPPCRDRKCPYFVQAIDYGRPK